MALRALGSPTILRRLLLVACAATLLAAPAAFADDASLKRTVKQQHAAWQDAERGILKGLDDIESSRKAFAAMLRRLGAYGDAVRAVRDAVDVERGSTADGRRARQLLLRALRQELTATGYLRRALRGLVNAPRPIPDRRKLRVLARFLGSAGVALGMSERISALREEALGLLGLPYRPVEDDSGGTPFR